LQPVSRAATLLGLALGFCIMSATTALSHHGLAAYDLNRQFTVEGTVTEFKFTNPHVYLYVDVKDKQGNIVNWILEGSGVYYWNRAGWNATSLKRGDRVTITLAPTKAGTRLGLLSKVVLPNGRELSMGR
jgi:hypothetical protein